MTMTNVGTESASSGKTRASLISRARDRHPDAWSELLDLYGPLVAHWCLRCGMDSHSTADCVQEVFASVSRSLAQYSAERRSGAFRGWLWTITSNKIKDEMRRRARGIQAIGGSTALDALQNVADVASLPSEEPSSQLELSRHIARGLMQIKAEFEDRTWAIFERTMIDQIPTEIVATEFGITSSAVRQVRSRVLRRLRLQIGDIVE